ncbi:MAG: hypothetical protein F6K62_19010 [Sphaerospermopsis sp. SIO1G2]|nr:hypothetical protein [Sphaerospermopsis sp. SIO1G1]NET72941.1 hypothetical protein [Sphaerospermopsis sp. SIO1G2]
MIAEDILAQEFTRIVDHYYPDLGEVLANCHVKVITSFWGQPAQKFQYIGIYCSDDILPLLQANKHLFREVAENMGLIQVVCVNAKKLLRDPLSKLRQSEPRLWLELQLVSA